MGPARRIRTLKIRGGRATPSLCACSTLPPHDHDLATMNPERIEPTKEQGGAGSDPRGRSTSGKASSHRARTRRSPAPGKASAGESDLEPHAESLPVSGIEREFAERQVLESQLDAQSEVWRQEVARRVEGYRTRRSRKSLAGQFSMRLDFGPSPATGPALDSLTITVSGSAQAFSSVSQVEEATSYTASPGDPGLPRVEEIPASTLEPLPDREPPSTPELVSPPPVLRPRESKLVEFPRSLVFPEFTDPDPDALAEPVLERLRILDVPEAIGVAPAPLSDIALQPKKEQAEEEFAPPAAFDLPLQVAAMRVRVSTALVDALLVVVAVAIFVMIVGQTTGGLMQNRMVLGLAVASAGVFWAAYYYLFLVHAGATPGMAMARVRLSTFEGDKVPRRVRRWRALIMVLSFAALGFGFLWALFDQDNLCWHDKMTRTYLTLDIG